MRQLNSIADKKIKSEKQVKRLQIRYISSLLLKFFVIDVTFARI